MRDPLGRKSIVVLIFSSIFSASNAQENLRDPTRPYVERRSVTVAAPQYKVNAIIVSSDRRVAIVNGQRVVIGGSVNGARVVTIEKDHLTLEKDGKRIRAALNDRASRQ